MYDISLENLNNIEINNKVNKGIKTIESLNIDNNASSKIVLEIVNCPENCIKCFANVSICYVKENIDNEKDINIEKPEPELQPQPEEKIQSLILIY